MPCIQEYGQRAERFRPFGPEDVQTEGPWFVIEPALEIHADEA